MFSFLFPPGDISASKGSTPVVMSPVCRLQNSLVFFGYFCHESSLLIDK